MAAKKKTTNKKNTASNKAPQKKRIKGKRYSDAEKAEIIAFVNEVNAANQARPNCDTRQKGRVRMG
jgi:hypothetical protein